VQEQELINQWKYEEQHAFTGWDFSHVQDRYIAAAPPWSYEETVNRLLPGTDSVLDMGTGGGEKLLEFKDSLPQITVATEGWPPNILVAQRNLEPHGIQVVPYNLDKEQRMPFADDVFSLVINRHEAFDAMEVARILKPGGVFLVQQARTMPDLSSIFGIESPYANVTLALCSKEVERAGFSIQFARESIDQMRFRDVGAFVYWAHACPWEVPADFSVERYSAVLLEMHTRGSLAFNIGHFIIQARKPL
jgi:SAM-dependent methyltransferase